MDKKKLIEIIEGIAPPELAEPWDNCGLQVNVGKNDIKKILIALEITNDVVEEAITRNADIIITHHPLIFGSLKCVDDNNFIGNYICKLIQNNISVYSCHTNFDKVDGGNNDYIAQILELSQIRHFSNNRNDFCRIGILPKEMTFIDFIKFAAKALNCDTSQFKAVGDLNKRISLVGVCTGSGAEFWEDAKDEGCDVFVTGDIKYHQGQIMREQQFCVLDCGHYHTEKIFNENFFSLISQKLTDVDIILSDEDINPFII